MKTTRRKVITTIVSFAILGGCGVGCGGIEQEVMPIDASRFSFTFPFILG